MKSPNILLIGIGGVYNYGCEAIVRGTEAIVHQQYPNAKIIYASPRPEDDRRKLEGCNVEVILSKFHRRYSFKNIVRKLLSLVGVKWQPMMHSFAVLDDKDAVFSIGGDLYTLGSNGEYNASLIKFGNVAERNGVSYILWGASVGPFSENPRAEKVIKHHLKRISLITARECATVKYLQEIGVFNNVIPCADPAYIVAPEIKANHVEKNNNLTVGINLSPLSVLDSKYSLEETICVQSRAIQELIKTLKARIVMIPHVVCDFNERDDDLHYLRKLKKHIAPKYQEAVTLIDNDLGFIGTKKELIKCDLVIAARMHCAINALAAHVPTILLSYSRKAVGMCEYVYGNGDWVIPLNEFGSNHTLEKIRSMIKQQQNIRTYLAERIPKIQQDAYRPMRALRKVSFFE